LKPAAFLIFIFALMAPAILSQHNISSEMQECDPETTIKTESGKQENHFIVSKVEVYLLPWEYGSFYEGNAALEIWPENKPEIVWQAKNDNRSRITIANVPDGKYFFKATAENRQSETGTITVSKEADPRAIIKIILPYDPEDFSGGIIFQERIEFRPWYVILSYHLLGITILLLIISLPLVSKKLRRKEALKSVVSRDFIKIFLYAQLAVFIFFFCLLIVSFFSSVHLNSEQNGFYNWNPQNLKFSLLYIVLYVLFNFFSVSSWYILDKKIRQEHNTGEVEIDKTAKSIHAYLVLINLFVLPFITAYIFQDPYHEGGLVLGGSFILGCASFASISIRKSLRKTTYMHAVCFFTHICLFFSACQVIIIYDLYNAVSFCNNLIPRIEKFHSDNGIYPKKIELILTPDDELPTMIRKMIVPDSGFYFYRSNEVNYFFQLCDYSRGSYEYRCDEYHWVAYHSVMW